jgi:hypothetical protein
MAIITDPDNLDRLQVLVNYVDQKIGIKAVDSTTPIVSLHNDLATQAGDTYLTYQGGAYPYAFKDTTRDFVSSGVASGDILTIVEGDNIDHWTITGLVGTTGLLVAPNTGQGFVQNNTGIGYAVLTGVNGTVTDGATLQAVYSFLKEEWKTVGAGYVDLIKFVFPLESITREQFEIGGATHDNWNWRDDDTRNLIRTGGWAAVSSAGQTLQRYAGIITLGSLDADTQVYYLQIDSSSGSPTQPVNFVSTGPVNQAILVSGDGGADLRNTLKLFARKKGRSYAESEIADIGVTQLETLVNRFPVTHAVDPAITATDGALAGGTAIYQATKQQLTASDGLAVINSASAQENTFTFSSAGSDFNAVGFEVGDIIHTSGSASGLDDQYFEIVDVVDANTLTLLQEPTINMAAEGTISFSANTRIRHDAETNATLQSFGGVVTTSGIIDAASALFRSSGVTAGDVAYVFGSGSAYNDELVGTYLVINTGVDETEIVVNTIDQPFPTAATAADYSVEVYRPGMHLQYKSQEATDVSADATSGLVITSAAPDTVQRRDGGDFYADGYVTGGILYIGNAEDAANVGSYVISGISTDIENADTISLAQAAGVTTNAADTLATLSGENGFIRAPQSTSYSFNWRLFGNNGTLSQCFQYLQKQLRRGANTDLFDASFRRVADIDTASGVFRGDITDLLMTFASPNGTTLNLYIDDLNSSEKNNVAFEDLLGISRNFAFTSTVSISVNQNLLDDSDTKVIVFFTNDDAGDNTGRDYGTDQAITVQDTAAADMISNDPSASPIDFEFDYDGNVQRGSASAGEDAPVTIVAIGLNTAQYVSTAGTVTRQSTNVFSLVSALERNYQT